MTAGGREPGRVQSVCKALDLLECLAGAGTPLSLGELSRRTGMPKATVHGLLSALRSGAVVEQSGEDGRYRLGIRLFEYGCAVSRGWNVLEAAAEPLRRVAEETGETASIAALDHGDVLILDSADARSNFRVVSEKGSRLPVHCTSQGKLLLAYLPPAQRRSLLRSCDFAARDTGVSLMPCASRASVLPVHGAIISTSNKSLGPIGSTACSVCSGGLPQMAVIFSKCSCAVPKRVSCVYTSRETIGITCQPSCTMRSMTVSTRCMVQKDPHTANPAVCFISSPPSPAYAAPSAQWQQPRFSARLFPAGSARE